MSDNAFLEGTKVLGLGVKSVAKGVRRAWQKGRRKGQPKIQ